MGNVTLITDKNGNELEKIDLNLLDFMYAQSIVNNYCPGESLMRRNINELLEKVYKKASEIDEAILVIIMNDKSHFDASHLPVLRRIGLECENSKIASIATKYANYILKYGEIQTEFIGVDMGEGLHTPTELKAMFG